MKIGKGFKLAGWSKILFTLDWMLCLKCAALFEEEEEEEEEEE